MSNETETVQTPIAVGDTVICSEIQQPLGTDYPVCTVLELGDDERLGPVARLRWQERIPGPSLQFRVATGTLRVFTLARYVDPTGMPSVSAVAAAAALALIREATARHLGTGWQDQASAILDAGIAATAAEVRGEPVAIEGPPAEALDRLVGDGIAKEQAMLDLRVAIAAMVVEALRRPVGDMFAGELAVIAAPVVPLVTAVLAAAREVRDAVPRGPQDSFNADRHRAALAGLYTAVDACGKAGAG